MTLQYAPVSPCIIQIIRDSIMRIHTWDYVAYYFCGRNITRCKLSANILSCGSKERDKNITQKLFKLIISLSLFPVVTEKLSGK